MVVGLPDGTPPNWSPTPLAAAITTLPRKLTRSLTWDQGLGDAAQNDTTPPPTIPLACHLPSGPSVRAHSAPSGVSVRPRDQRHLRTSMRPTLARLERAASLADYWSRGGGRRPN